MYTEFYGLKEKPFNLTPSPRFVYLSEGHKEAMALLTYGVTERKGFILLTGEVGTGKTTMIHNLIDSLDASVEYVYIVNPILSPEEFIDYLAFSSFKRRIHFRSKADFLLEFEDFLRTCMQHQKVFILIIDEAHKLSFELLEEIRLLSNMEYAEEKLINIFLVGQPELNDNLNSPKGRATLQRIGIRYDIPPLSLKETGEYIETRLNVAGAPKKGDIFQKDAIETIYKFSQGYPRTINILADNAMLLGYSRDKKIINASMIEESYNSMKLEGSFLEDSVRSGSSAVTKTAPHTPYRRPLRWAFVLLFVLMLAAIIVFMVNTSKMSVPDFLRFMSSGKHQDTTLVKTSSSVLKGGGDKPGPGDNFQGEEEGANDIRPDAGLKQATADGKSPFLKGDGRTDSEGLLGNGSINVDWMQQIELTDLPILIFKSDSGYSKSVITKEGDTLIRLAEKEYGYAGEEELELLRSYNPEITDVDKIDVGQRIFFPVYTILIGSDESYEKAEDLFQQLKKDGFDANIISPGDDDRPASYQVTIGTFNNKMEADDFASKHLKGRRYNAP